MPKGRTIDYTVKAMFGNSDIDIPDEDSPRSNGTQGVLNLKRKKRKTPTVYRRTKGLSTEFGEGEMKY